jgi:glycosyltransferase involved in cell wall biosynthesis
VTEEPFFTILTACLNNGVTLRETLQSVNGQTFRDLEHLVIDGGSTDNTLSILKDYEGTYNLTWRSEPDRGISDALNKGLQLAKGRFVFVLQADDSLIDRYSLEKAHHLILRHQADIFSFPVLFKITESAEHIIRPIRLLWYHHFKFIFHHQGLFVDKHLIEKVGGFRKRFKISMDYDFTYRALKNNPTVHFERIPIARMYGGGVSSFVYDRVKEDRRVQLLNEENLLWRIGQMLFYAFYLPYKKFQHTYQSRSNQPMISKR